MAPDDLIASILQIPLGSVTPLAVSQPTATDVVLLLDIKLKSEQAPFFVHPLTNTSSLALTSQHLEAFLGSLGKEAVWVDLEAYPKIDRENPPDLKHIADAAKVIVSIDSAAGEGGGSSSTSGGAAAAPAAGTKKDKKKSGGGGESKADAAAKEKAQAAAAAARAASDVYAITDSVVGKVAVALGVDLTTSIDGDDLRRLKADVVMQLNALKNAAYSAGFKSAQSAVVASIQGEFS
jgi:hypothetical protein